MALTPTQTRELLDRLGHAPKRKLGQNFLVDGNIVAKSLDMAEVAEGDAVVEIGAGLGALTRALLERGARVHAIEQDPALANYLRGSLRTEFPDRVAIMAGDAVQRPLAGLPDDRARRGFKVAANLPYAVATPWMDALLAGPLPESMTLMLQKEAADRYVAAPGSKSFGAISIFLRAAYEPAVRHAVSAGCFYPAPKVGSALLRLDRKPDAARFPAENRALIRRIFTRRRKQLAPLLRADPAPLAREWLASLQRQGVAPTARAEEVPLRYWLELAAPATEASASR